MSNTAASLSEAPRVAGKALSDGVYAAIYQRIASGEWSEGLRLPTEIELGQQFGVSRTVIREALLRLRIDGLITSKQGAGIHVSGRPSRSVLSFAQPGSIADIQRCYEFRVGTEGEAAFLAAERRSPDKIEAIEAALAAMETCIRNDGLGAEEDIQFHLAVASATENDYYLGTIESVAQAIRIAMKIASTLSPLPPGERLRLAYDEHNKILAAIRSGRAEEARRLMRAHIESSRRRVFVGV